MKDLIKKLLNSVKIVIKNVLGFYWVLGFDLNFNKLKKNFGLIIFFKGFLFIIGFIYFYELSFK